MFQRMVVNQRFDRCLTPMGTVPISVIYGFNYPVGEGKKSKSPPTIQSSTTSPTRGAVASPAWPSSLSTFRHQAEVKNAAQASADCSIFWFDALAFKWCCRWTEEREQWSQLILGTQSTRQCLLVQQETQHIRAEHHQPPAAVWWGAGTCLHQETTHHHHHLGGAPWQGGHDQTLSIITRSCLVTETSHWAAPVGQELILEQHFLISEENFSNTAIIVSCNKTVMEKKKIYCSTKLLTLQ